MPVYVKANIERGAANSAARRPHWGNASLDYQKRLKRLWDEAMARAYAV
jgi:hypothetical protein